MAGQDTNKLVMGAGGAGALVLLLIVLVAVTTRGGDNPMQAAQFSRRVSECDQFYEWGKETEESGELEAASQYNISHYTSLCKIDGKRILVNPDKRPYNISEVILWTLDNGNTINSLELDNSNSECYYFERLERVLATQLMAKQRWKAVKLKQKFDRQRFKNFTGRYSEDNMFISKGGSEKEIYAPEEGADTGLFASVLQAYKNHWVLRTSPDDWFFPVIRRIAQVVDDNALHPEVQRYLGRGQPVLGLKVNFNRGFEAMFQELSQQITKNLVTSEYAKVFEANFTTTSPNDRLVSQLILMSSVQKYFNFNTYIACGIPEVEMLGTEADWRALIQKLEDIKKVLAPISGPLGNITDYFDQIVRPVYDKLLDTFLGKPDKAWWNDIVLRQAKVEQVCTKLKKVVERWDGWLVEFLNGERNQEMRDIPSGLLTVPLLVDNTLFNISYPATLVAGQIGFSLHEETVPVVEPYAGWAMLTTQDTHQRVRAHIKNEIARRRRERTSRRQSQRRNRQRY
jgi:hypothetical protein